MRLNKFIATHTDLSRREADELIAAGKAQVNGQVGILGQRVQEIDSVTVNGYLVAVRKPVYVMLHKPTGYVCSRRGQGAPTVYELLPSKYRGLKTVGRLDKDSSGLILLSNDGDFANIMTHPSFAKEKIYEVELNKPLDPEQKSAIERGIELGDGPSRFEILTYDIHSASYVIRITEGRNRQIRRTFAALGLIVTKLHRNKFGPYTLGRLQSGRYRVVESLK